MKAHAMPFGKYRGRPLVDVPADYLGWFLKTCKLTPGLRTAIRNELVGRGADPSSLPAEPATQEAFCRSCGSVDVRARWQELAGGRRAIRADCRDCGRFVAFLPQTPENAARVGRSPNVMEKAR